MPKVERPEGGWREDMFAVPDRVSIKGDIGLCEGVQVFIQVTAENLTRRPRGRCMLVGSIILRRADGAEKEVFNRTLEPQVLTTLMHGESHVWPTTAITPDPLVIEPWLAFEAAAARVIQHNGTLTFTKKDALISVTLSGVSEDRLELYFFSRELQGYVETSGAAD